MSRAGYHPRRCSGNVTCLSEPCRAVAEQATAADKLIDEAIAAGLDGSHAVTIHAKMLRAELLRVKADLQRELGTWMLTCKSCGRDVWWVSGLGFRPGHWSHGEPAPHHDPVV